MREYKPPTRHRLQVQRVVRQLILDDLIGLELSNNVQDCLIHRQTIMVVFQCDRLQCRARILESQAHLPHLFFVLLKLNQYALLHYRILRYHLRVVIKPFDLGSRT